MTDTDTDTDTDLRLRQTARAPQPNIAGLFDAEPDRLARLSIDVKEKERRWCRIILKPPWPPLPKIRTSSATPH
jgi:hypothetical protein